MRRRKDQWLREESGLWLPERRHPLRSFGSGKHHACPMHAGAGIKCCCGTCLCVCDACAENRAPCCWKVYIGGMVNGTCTRCARFNSVYYLKQTAPNACTWSCEITKGCTECATATLTLTVASNKITVTLGSHKWEKDFGTELPDCCAPHTLTHVTSSGDCSSSSAQCSITPGTAAYCPCECNELCEFCLNDISPYSVAVDIGTVANSYQCTLCNFYSNKTYVLNIVPNSSCVWNNTLPNCESDTSYGCGACYGALGCRCYMGVCMTFTLNSGNTGICSGYNYKSYLTISRCYDTYRGYDVLMATYQYCWDDEAYGNTDCTALDITMTRVSQNYDCNWPDTVQVTAV